ncbi:MAG TPA: amidohydrolase family protein [Chthoniobacterales bacterium]|jgi:predicted TIM-barrel fold metal-dependent hydrolase|nr:amidohydrolase family protein [Chthoniobacterales bacterium]
MFTTKSGEKIFVIDSHMALWDASPANQRNRHGEEFINCFYNYHKISPKEYYWSREKFEKYSEADLMKDLFEEGYVDMAIFQPAYLGEFYKEGFGNLRRNWALIQKHPDRLIGNGWFDPRNGEPGLEQLEREAEMFKLKGVKLYTAEWYGNSKGYKLSDAWSQRYLEKCIELGIKNIHVHKGPTILPLNRDAFDVADVDDAASTFPDLNFIVEHCGLPRLDDFCWIATQEPNVYAGLAVASALIHTRRKYFSEIITELLYWLGADRILFGSDYAIWRPKWIIEQFMDLELSDELAAEANHTLSLEVQKKIMAENCARLYDIDIAKQCARLGLPIVEEPVHKDVGVGVG